MALKIGRLARQSWLPVRELRNCLLTNIIRLYGCFPMTMSVDQARPHNAFNICLVNVYNTRASVLYGKYSTVVGKYSSVGNPCRGVINLITIDRLQHISKQQ